MKSLVFSMLILISLSASAEENRVVYEVAGEKYEGRLIMPVSSAPLVLIIHDWDGLTEYEMKRADMLTALGYSVFAVDLFGAGVRPVEMSSKKQLTEALYNDREKMRKLLQGAFDYAKSKGANVDRAVAMGYCFGGSATLEFARSGVDLKGFVSFHGGLNTPEGQDYSKTKGKILILHGTADESVSMDDFSKLAKEFEKSGIRHEMISYGGAPHAFTVFGSERYREDADLKSWRRFTEFLEETLRR